ncbi:MAG: hypothetical protein Kow00117_04900 [Phototrophicales bacterium]
MARRIIIMIFILMLAACNGGNEDEPAPNVHELIDRAAALMQDAQTFSLEIIAEGAPFVFLIEPPGIDPIEVSFNRAIGQYVTPGEIYATVNVNVGRLTLDAVVYANGDDQWFQIPPLVGWVNSDFAEGFNPTRLVGADSGFRAALVSIVDLEYVGRESINGVGVYHIAGTANGEDISNLLLSGLIDDMTGIVPVQIYLHQETGYPVRLIVEQPGTATETDPNTTWKVDVFDINEPSTIVPPEGA